MATVRRKISELTALASASLDTTLLGVDSGTTYKIELDTLADAVTARVNILDRNRLSALETYTASFSPSAIDGTISSSAQISAFGFISSSHTDITSLNSFTSSQSALNTAFTNGINARLTTSSFESFSSSVHSEILAATNEQDLSGYVTDLVYNVLSQSVDTRIDNLELNSGSYLTSLDGAISSSAQITAFGFVSQSTDIADFTFTEQTITNGAITLEATNSDIVLNADGAVYIGSSNAGNQIITDSYLTGVIGDTEMVNNGTGNTITDNLTNIINSIPTIPDGIISGSEQITTFGFISSSQTIDTGSLATTGSNAFSGNQTINGSLTINFSNGIPTDVSNWNGQGGWNQGYYSNVTASGGTGTGLTVDVAAGGGGYIGINQITINTPGSGYTNGDIVTIDNENNLPGQFTIEVGATTLELDASGGLVFPDATTQTTAFIPTSFVNASSFNQFTSSLNGAIEITGSDVSFLGNIVVYGTQSVINSTNVELSDNILYLSPTASTDNDLGIVGHYNDGTYRHAGIFMDASDGHSWKVFKGLQTETTATVDTSGTGFALADFKAGVITGTSFNGIVNATNGVISSSANLVTTSSFNSYTASISTGSLVNRLNTIESISGSWITESETGSFLRNLNGAISSSSQLTGSFDTRYTLSGSVQPLPSGLISGSSQLTSSFETTGRGIISGSSQITGVLTPSNLSTTGQVSASVFVGGYLVPEAKFTVISSKPMTFWPNSAYEAVRFTTGNNVIIGGFGGTVDYGYRLDVSGSMRVWGNTILTGSLIVNGGITGQINATNGVVSGSSQLTSSFDTRYTLSGSVQNITLPSNLVSSSAQITALGFLSSSTTINTGSFVTTSSFNAFTASALTTGSNTFSGSQIISGSLFVTGLTSISTSFSLPTGSSLLILSGSNIYVDASGSITGSLSGSVFGIGDVVAFSSSVNSRINNIISAPAGTISGSSQLTSSFDGRYLLTGSVTSSILQLNTFTASVSTASLVTSITNLNTFTASQSTSSLVNRLNAIESVSGSWITESETGSFLINLNGAISSSSQLTSSFDIRYAASGSVGGVAPAGTVSGSSQLTSSLDLRYLVTGSTTSSILQLNTFTASNANTSLNSFTSSLNIWSSSVATTGSNSFNGNQTITGSLNVSSMAVVSSSFTTNSSSLYLTSGSNFYLQNNGRAEITGSLVVTGTATFNDVVYISASSGDEGGELRFALPQTNNSLTGSVNIDVWRNRLRLWEGGGNARGVFVDLSKAPDGVGGELLWKATGLVNSDVDVTLGNLKARLASSGNRSLQVSTVSGTYSVYGSSVYSYNGIGGVTLSSPLSITTTPTYLSAGYNFLVAGSTDTWIITDTSAGISWRISLMIGPSFTNNMISIERLV